MTAPNEFERFAIVRVSGKRFSRTFSLILFCGNVAN